MPLFLALFAGTESSASGNAGVTTDAAQVAADDSFSFVVWGHPAGRDHSKPGLHFEEILGRISELNADFLVITGDVVNCPNPTGAMDAYRSKWEMFDEGVSRLGIPVYRVPGNHDVCNFTTRDLFIERYIKPPYAFTFRNSRFILLDTVGIDQRTEDGQPHWSPQSLPFDDDQIEMIRGEIGQQGQYQHLFFFMHHVWPWRELSSFWWDKVHPLLAGGHTRVVFGGTIGNPGYKYEHFQEDGIHYIQSSTFSGRWPRWYQREIELGRFEPAMAYQFNNLQYVRVEGGEYTIQTIVVGALDDKELSSRFWREVDQPAPWTWRISKYFRENFHSFRRLLLFVTILGFSGLLLGIVTGVLWMRRKTR
jgi:3',5'-cyclic AMP phosphodiesterase CpdA